MIEPNYGEQWAHEAGEECPECERCHAEILDPRQAVRLVVIPVTRPAIVLCPGCYAAWCDGEWNDVLQGPITD